MDTSFTILALILAGTSTVAAVVGAVWAYRGAQRAATVDQFVATRRYLKDYVPDLIELAIARQSALLAEDAIPLLARPGWILRKPVPIDKVMLRRIEPRPSHRCDAALATLQPYWPMGAHGERMSRYHEAVGEYDRPTNWFNGASYRLLQIDVRDLTLEMTFTATKYWDMFDTTEVLLYEAALAHCRSRGRTIQGRYRRFLSDPFRFHASLRNSRDRRADNPSR